MTKLEIIKSYPEDLKWKYQDGDEKEIFQVLGYKKFADQMEMYYDPNYWHNSIYCKPIFKEMKEFDKLESSIKITMKLTYVGLDVRELYEACRKENGWEYLPYWMIRLLLDNKYNIFNLPEGDYYV